MPDHTSTYMLKFGLSGGQARILDVLMTKDLATQADLRATTQAAESSNSASVLLCKMRKKVEPLGITIATLYGRGYAMPEESKARVREIAGLRS